MDGECSTPGKNEKCLQYFGCKTWKEETTWKTRNTWEDNIRMDLREIRSEVVDGIRLAQNRDQWQYLVNTVMKLSFP